MPMTVFRNALQERAALDLETQPDERCHRVEVVDSDPYMVETPELDIDAILQRWSGGLASRAMSPQHFDIPTGANGRTGGGMTVQA